MELTDEQTEGLTELVSLMAAMRRLQEADFLGFGEIASISEVVDMVKRLKLGLCAYPTWKDLAWALSEKGLCRLYLTDYQTVAKEAAEYISSQGIDKSRLLLELMDIVKYDLPREDPKMRFAFMYLCSPIVSEVMGVPYDPEEDENANKDE